MARRSTFSPPLCNSFAEIAKFCNMSRSNVGRVYFAKDKKKKHDMGRALDVGVYLLSKGLSEDDIRFMADFVIEYKDRLSKKLGAI